jgi:hypothetical protein
MQMWIWEVQFAGVECLKNRKKSITAQVYMEDIPSKEQQIQNLKNGQNVVVSMPQLTEFREGAFEAGMTSSQIQSHKNRA